MSAPVKRVLPADVYDALEFSALVEGGIGAGRYFVNGGKMVPYCIYGHAYELDRECGSTVLAALANAGVSVSVNDRAVHAINKRRRQPRYARVSFADWCAEMGVERGS